MPVLPAFSVGFAFSAVELLLEVSLEGFGEDSWTDDGIDSLPAVLLGGCSGGGGGGGGRRRRDDVFGSTWSVFTHY